MTRVGSWHANRDGSQPGVLLKCPVCTGENYYAIMKHSGQRILACPSLKCGYQTGDSSGLPKVCPECVFRKRKDPPLMVVRGRGKDTCPNCGHGLERAQGVTA